MSSRQPDETALSVSLFYDKLRCRILTFGKILNVRPALMAIFLCESVSVALCVAAEAHPLLSVMERGWDGWIRPVDIAIGDGKNVSVNVTALSVPFSPVKGHHHRLPDTLETASSAGHRHDIKLQHASAHTTQH